jgi:hypothetical protein
MTKKILITLIILSFFIASFLSYKAFAEDGKAVILFIQGEVKIQRQGIEEWRDATKGMFLSNGDKLKTGYGSWSELGLGKNYENAVRIQENTLIELTDLGPVEINLFQGELRALVEKLSKDETFRIRTPMSVCGVRGTGWDTNNDGEKVVVDVYENDVYFSGVSQKGGVIEGSTVNAGKRGMLEDPMKPIVIKDVPADRIEDWNIWKEDFIKRMGIEGSIKGKTEKIEQGQKATEDMTKGKEATFETGDKGIMKDRLETDDGGQY